MFLIVGLGNIGSRYNLTRHNIGFEAVDYFAQLHGLKIEKEGFKGVYVQGNIGGAKAILLKPSTYMNLSGESVAAAVNYFKIETQNMIVIHDDADFTPGEIKIRKTGSGGTHNGMRSITGVLGREDFVRIRIGIGNNKNFELYDYVLSRFLPEEIPVMRQAVVKTASILDTILSEGVDAAMNQFNRKAEKASDGESEETDQ